MFAVFLAGLAGYLDGLAFVRLNGFFVSFMSGNSTRLGVGLGGGDREPALIAGAILLLFVLGVVTGALVGRAAGERYRLAILASETLLLLAGAVLQRVGQGGAAIGAVILATGVENSVFQRDGVVTTGLTYVTGALVKMGQRMAAALAGEALFGWASSALLWLGFVLGATLGGAGYRAFGLGALWLAVAWAAVATLAEVLLVSHARR